MRRWRWLPKLVLQLPGNAEAFSRRILKLNRAVVDELNRVSDAWSSTVIRPKRPQAARSLISQETRAAVVLQGPVRHEDDFTLETVRYYAKTMPDCLLIVAGWQDESPARIRAWEEAGAQFVCARLPERIRLGSGEWQIRSTLAGLQRAQEAGSAFALVTRTDARIYGYHVIDFLAGLLRTFPLSSNAFQQQRIVILDDETRLLEPNHLSVTMTFGRLGDLEAFWSAPVTCDEKAGEQFSAVGELEGDSALGRHLCECHLERIGYPLERSVENWWKSLRELFIVVDRTAIDYFCLSSLGGGRYPVPDHDRTEASCSFREWVSLYAFPEACRDRSSPSRSLLGA